jgi:hypothetical protein
MYMITLSSSGSSFEVAHFVNFVSSIPVIGVDYKLFKK